MIINITLFPCPTFALELQLKVFELVHVAEMLSGIVIVYEKKYSCFSKQINCIH